jgi:uncharacterized membrane-anchored protein
MSASSKVLGAGAVVMALCCALLPLVGAALGGGLVAGSGGLGLVAGVLVLAAVIAVVVRRRRERGGC